MPGQLGSGKNRAMIYSRGGATDLLALKKLSDLQWGRSRNAFSTAQVTVTADDAGFGALEDVHTWAHELVIFRDDERVWEGPIRYIDRGQGDCILYGVDVLGWLAKRRVSMDRRLGDGVTASVIDEMELSLTRALTPDDPNVLSHRLVAHDPAELQVSRDVRAGSGFYSDDFTGMAGTGAYFTVLGRMVIIWPEQLIMGRTETLQPELHTTSAPRVVEDGDALATTYTAVDQDDRIRTKIASSSDVNATTGVSTYYGRHDGLITVSESSNTTFLDGLATFALGDTFPAPVSIVMAGDTALKPNAPMRISELVPGMIVPVEYTRAGARISGTMVIDSMKVQQGAGAESVSVTLQAPSIYAIDGTPLP